MRPGPDAMNATVRIRMTAIAIAVVAVVVTVLAAERVRAELDLTQDRSLTLTDTTLDVIDDLEGRVRITAFLSRREVGRAEAVALLDRYRRASSHITYRVLDPDDAPGELRRLGLDPALGGVALERGEQIERGPTVSEQDVTSGLARLARDVDESVCFTTSHGERPPSAAAEGFGGLRSLLEDNGYTVRDAGGSLDGCTVAVVAAPTADIDAADPLVGWLDGGGRALVLTDPESTASVEPLLAPFGLGVRRGIVLETNANGHVPGDPATPIVAAYRSGFPFVRRLPPTIYPGAQAIDVSDDLPEGVAAAAVASTTSGAVLRRDGASDVAGPLTLVAAADRSEVDRGSVIRSRLVVAGDVDLFSDAFLGELGHGRLAVQAIDWLALDDDLVSVSANLARPRPLLLTPARLTYLRVLTAGVVPLAFLVAGIAVWTMRRSR